MILCAAVSHYFIAIKQNEGDVLNTLETFTPFVAPEDRFYADPFLFKHEGINYLFFENYNGKKGVISYVTLDGAITEPQLALELPIHLSFPFVFEEEGEIYMVPETYRSRSVSLYKCIKFPDQWECKQKLVQGKHFSDPILFKHEGWYWLFTAVDVDRLCIFYAKDLDSPFLPHPINHRGMRGRNAGAVFYDNGRLIRPTMDCSHGYGRSMMLKEIVLLTPQKFVEKEIAAIEPTWAPHLRGTHSYNQNEDFVVYDGSL